MCEGVETQLTPMLRAFYLILESLLLNKEKQWEFLLSSSYHIGIEAFLRLFDAACCLWQQIFRSFYKKNQEEVSRMLVDSLHLKRFLVLL